jgi:hypothetical protein
MKKTLFFILVITAGLFAFRSAKSGSNKVIGQSISVNWVDNLPGDFSFRNKWSYPEGVYKNQYGQLSCDGICPAEIDAMIDSKGRIYKDSLKSFYKIVDTTHLAHSIKCEAWCYEWAGTNFIEVMQKSVDTVECFTSCNAATHCSLHLDFVKDTCYPAIVLKSIVSGGDAIYYCTNGYIKIDKKLWAQGIMKAEFSFNFGNKESPQKPIYWKGKIYTKISKL